MDRLEIFMRTFLLIASLMIEVKTFSRWISLDVFEMLNEEKQTKKKNNYNIPQEEGLYRQQNEGNLF